MLKLLFAKLDRLIQLFTEALMSLNEMKESQNSSHQVPPRGPIEDITYITFQEASAKYRFSVKSFERWNKSKLFPAYYIGSHPVHDAYELQQWIKTHKSRRHSCQGCDQ